MRALMVTSERAIEIREIDEPGAPAPGEVSVRVAALALNHIDLWGFRGMAFVKRTLPMIVGAEAAGHVITVGDGVEHLRKGDLVSLYGALTCGTCPACLSGRDNFCEASGTVGNIFGFHIDGFAREIVNLPARLAVPAPAGLDVTSACLAPITFGTPQHMLFDGAALQAGETVLVQAGGSGVGSAAIQLAKAAGAHVIATVGSDEKGAKALALGANHVINYRTSAFETQVRRLTRRKGVDVVVEHIGPDTFAGSMFCLRRGGRLITCGSTTGVQAKINLFTLYQQQLRLIGSFGCTRQNMTSAMGKLQSAQVRPVIDSILPLSAFAEGVKRLETRDVFGKIVLTL